MTKISFEGGKVVFRDGKVGTEEECRCGGICALLHFRAVALGYETGNRSPCEEDLYNVIKAKIEAAGYTVSVIEQANDDGFTYITWQLSCDCCLDCETMTNLSVVDGELVDQPAGMWVNVASWFGPPGLGADVDCPDNAVFYDAGQFFFRGCCGDLDILDINQQYLGVLMPTVVNGVSCVTPANSFACWIPACDPGSAWCNPLP